MGAVPETIDTTSEPTRLTLSAAAQNATPFLAAGPVPAAHLFHIPAWAPRTGRTLAFSKWELALHLLLAAYGLSPQQLYDAPPINPLHADSTPTRAESDRRRAQATARSEWLAINTSIYWHVLPSLIISGLNEAMDREHIDKLAKERYRASRRSTCGLTLSVQSQVELPPTRTILLAMKYWQSNISHVQVWAEQSG